MTMYEIAMMFWGSVAGVGLGAAAVAAAVEAARVALYRADAMSPREATQGEAFPPASSRKLAPVA